MSNKNNSVFMHLNWLGDVHVFMSFLPLFHRSALLRDVQWIVMNIPFKENTQILHFISILTLTVKFVTDGHFILYGLLAHSQDRHKYIWSKKGFSLN